jgi:hypothetical protein
MEGFDPESSFGYDESKRYDAVDIRGDEERTVGFLAQLSRFGALRTRRIRPVGPSAR